MLVRCRLQVRWEQGVLSSVPAETAVNRATIIQNSYNQNSTLLFDGCEYLLLPLQNEIRMEGHEKIAKEGLTVFENGVRRDEMPKKGAKRKLVWCRGIKVGKQNCAYEKNTTRNVSHHNAMDWFSLRLEPIAIHGGKRHG